MRSENHPAWFSAVLAGEDDPVLMRHAFPWAEAMVGCPHDPVHHAEGDPWVHTCLVSGALQGSDGFHRMPDDRRLALKFAAWFHDVAKPMTTVLEKDDEGRDRVRQPGHSPLGAKIAWGEMVDAGADPRLARDVHALVFWHQRPAHLPKRKSPQDFLIRFGQETAACTWDDLLRLCRADQEGRVSLEKGGSALDDLEMVRMMLEDESVNAGVDLTRSPWPFSTAAARRRYLSAEGKASPFFTPREPSGSKVVLMSGLQGSGKDTYARERLSGLPVVSMDDIRARMGVAPGDDQGRVVQEALNEARRHLRSGEDFVWNATCLSRMSRGKICSLAAAYDARIDAVSIDVPLDVARVRNLQREDPVPDAVIVAAARKREPVLPSEAHSVTSIDAAGESRLIFGDPETSPEPAFAP